MLASRNKTWAIVVLFSLWVFLLAGCSTDGAEDASDLAHTTQVVWPFGAFYKQLGGQEVLGPAISGPDETIQDGLTCQFTERALMCFNPAGIDNGRFFLYPLGYEFSVHDSPQPAAQGAKVVDGYVIYEPFIPLYDRLNGAYHVGKPLTQVRVNYELSRIEQFFENVGFYIPLDDPDAQAQLIPYGAYLCRGGCASRLKEYWAIVGSGLVGQPFASSLDRLGGVAVVGNLISRPYIAPDGMLEQAYENVVLYSPQEDPSQVRLRPAPGLLGMQAEAPGLQNPDSRMVFYDQGGGLGYNVPRILDEYIAQHGGMDLAGQPIGEIRAIENGIYRQCFTNYCLDYDHTAQEGLKIRLTPLGREYAQRALVDTDALIQDSFTPETVYLLTVEEKPTVAEGEEQVVRLMVVHRPTGKPLQRVEATLTLNAPGRPVMTFAAPPTDEDGFSSVRLPGLRDLPNSTIIEYRVCLNLPSTQPLCTTDSYMIWN